jgi:glycosidase
MWGANDPDCRKPMLWPDIVFEAEEYLPNQSKRPADAVEINTDLYIFYKKIIAIRNAHPALQHGTFTTVLVDDDADVFIFKRETSEEAIYVVLNNAETPQEIKLPKTLKGEFADLLMLKKPISGSINVAGKWGAILLQSKK